MPYIIPDSTVFSIAESTYNITYRIQRGDLSLTESQTQSTRIGSFRSNVTFTDVKFQSIMLGDQLFNFLYNPLDTVFKEFVLDRCMVDIDGRVYNNILQQTLTVTNNQLNLTNMYNGFYVDVQSNCSTPATQQAINNITITGNYFFARHQQALLSFFTFNTHDNIIFERNTMDNCSFIAQVTRPFWNFANSAFCDIAGRTQLISFSHNKFVNLQNSNLAAILGYLTAPKATRVFQVVNNTVLNSELNSQFMTIQIQTASTVTIANNNFQNSSTQDGYRFMILQGNLINMTIQNETINGGSSFDDLYQIQSGNYINITNVTVQNFSNPQRTSSGRALFRLFKANNNLTIDTINVKNSSMNYGSIIQIDQANQVNVTNVNLQNNSVKNNNLFILNQIQRLRVENISIDSTQKNSDKQRFVFSLPYLQMVDNYSSHTFQNISFSNSQCSLLQFQLLNMINATSTYQFSIMISNVNLTNNTLLKKDSLISVEKIQNRQMTINFTNFQITGNSLYIGQVFYISSNVKTITLSNSSISLNKGQLVQLQPALLTIQDLLSFRIDNVTFTQNNGFNDGMLWIQTNSQMKVTNSQFIENYSFGRGSVMFADFQSARALFQNCSFIRNYAYNGGVFYASYLSSIEVQNSLIQENFAIIGGVAYVNNDGILKINSNTIITKNQALNACLLFTINSGYSSQFANVTISQNDQNNPLIVKSMFLSIDSDYKHFKKDYFDFAQTVSDKIEKTATEKTDSAFLAIYSKFDILNTFIYQNDNLIASSTESVVNLQDSIIQDVLTQNQMIQAVFSQININNLTIQNITQIQSPTQAGTFLMNFQSQSTLTAQQLTLQNVQGLIMYATESVIIKQNLTMINITSNDYQKSMFAIDNSAVNFNNGTVQNITQQFISPIFMLNSNNCTFTNMSISYFDKALFVTQNGNSNFTLLNVSNYNKTLVSSIQPYIIESALVFSSISSNVTIDQTNVTGIRSNFTSPVVNSKGTTTANYINQLVITNSNFTMNKARTTGGAVMSINNDVLIDNTVFQSNIVTQGSAGALMLQCDEDFDIVCNYKITNSQFINNTALLNGGAIYYTYYPPQIDGNNNTFTNNSAQYGQDVGAFPVKLEFADNLSQVTRRQLGVTQNISRLSDSQVQQLGLVNAIVYQITDYQVSGNLITQSFSFNLVDNNDMKLVTDSISEASLIALDPNNVSLLKSRSVLSNQGKFTFDDVIVIAKPGTQVTLKIQSDSINQAKIRDAYGQQTQDIYVMFNMRLCAVGEYQTADNKCVVCSDGFYTLYTNQSTCYECPANAICTDGFKIIVDQGYWRSDVNSTTVYQCENQDACMSSYEPLCAPGYGGNLCQSCVKYGDNWYSMEETNSCTECLDYKTNSLRLAGVALLIVIYFLILIIVNVRTTGKQKVTTVYMRILTNYFQILTLAQSYDLSWEDSMKKFLQAMSFIAKASEMVISQDCFIRGSVNNMHPLYVKMIIATFFPLALIVFICIVWYVYGCIKKGDLYINHMIVSIIIFVFVSINPITSLVFQLFNCKDIFNDGTKYLVIDNSLECWSGQHALYAKATGIPILIIWVIGLPFTALVAMYKRRSQLGEARNIQRYGFLYVGLVEEAFYWEILIYFRKVAMISVNVFFISFKPLYRALIGFMILIFYIELLQKIKPYQSQQLNYLEFKANIAAFATFYGGLFFINADFPFSVTIVFVILIILLNANFWLAWINLMFTKQYDMVAGFLRKRVFCFIKNKNTNKQKYGSMLVVNEDAFPHNEFDDMNDSSFHTKNQTMIEKTKQKINNESSKNNSSNSKLIQLKKTLTSSQKEVNHEFDDIQYDVKDQSKDKDKKKSSKKPKLGQKEIFSQRLDQTRLGDETNLMDESNMHLMESPYTKPSHSKHNDRSEFDDYSQQNQHTGKKTKTKRKEKESSSKKRRNKNMEQVFANDGSNNNNNHQSNNIVFNPSSTIDKSLFGDIQTPIKIEDTQIHSKVKKQNSKLNDSYKELQNNINKNDQDRVVSIIAKRNKDNMKNIAQQKYMSSPAKRHESKLFEKNHEDGLEVLQSFDQFMFEQIKTNQDQQQITPQKVQQRDNKKLIPNLHISNQKIVNYQPSEEDKDDDNDKVVSSKYSVRNKQRNAGSSRSVKKAMEATFNPNMIDEDQNNSNTNNNNQYFMEFKDQRVSQPQSLNNKKSSLAVMTKAPPTSVIVNKQQDVEYEEVKMQSPIIPFDRATKDALDSSSNANATDLQLNQQNEINRLPLPKLSQQNTNQLQINNNSNNTTSQLTLNKTGKLGKGVTISISNNGNNNINGDDVKNNDIEESDSQHSSRSFTYSQGQSSRQQH